MNEVNFVHDGPEWGHWPRRAIAAIRINRGDVRREGSAMAKILVMMSPIFFYVLPSGQQSCPFFYGSKIHGKMVKQRTASIGCRYIEDDRQSIRSVTSSRMEINI